ncbi:MAG: hypothetical protein K8J31_02490 [Anaerolineae bacterium]|nr:hypothetical protein [Anaerolineae bacterium]
MASQPVLHASDMKCATCSLRASADANPRSLKARLWRWHTTWCPGWKAYQKALKSEQS